MVDGVRGIAPVGPAGPEGGRRPLPAAPDRPRPEREAEAPEGSAADPAAATGRGPEAIARWAEAVGHQLGGRASPEQAALLARHGPRLVDLAPMLLGKGGGHSGVAPAWQELYLGNLLVAAWLEEAYGAFLLPEGRGVAQVRLPRGRGEGGRPRGRLRAVVDVPPLGRVEVELEAEEDLLTVRLLAAPRAARVLSSRRAELIGRLAARGWRASVRVEAGAPGATFFAEAVAIDARG